jgi:hypothetical protein
MMTDLQRSAFGFAGENLVFSEICKLVEELQEQQWMIAIARDTRGEDRIHAAGNADGINLVLSTLAQFRAEARRLNGLTDKEEVR